MPTKIEWAEETWNPVTGCTPISAGCVNCYAKRMARWLAGRSGYPEAPNHFDVTLHPLRLDQPSRWRKPRHVFVCSMGDLFHDDVPAAYITTVLAHMASTPQHTFQVLTKRPQRMLQRLAAINSRLGLPRRSHLPNLWLGVTAENQAAADERIPLLLQTPAAVRFVSCEPCLTAIDLHPWLNQNYDPARHKDWCGITHGLSWCVVGGESGPSARPMHPAWARSLRDQCQQANVPFFFKQWGAWSPDVSPYSDAQLMEMDRYNGRVLWDRKSATMVRVGKKAAGRLLDGRTWNEFPR